MAWTLLLSWEPRWFGSIETEWCSVEFLPTSLLFWSLLMRKARNDKLQEPRVILSGCSKPYNLGWLDPSWIF
uniref:Uncharacterized protein n=1 Tax=Zea mays TaxID=4577 RepID=B6T011_MAIZE|nr:hypothetical protein [Zea mays]